MEHGTHKFLSRLMILSVAAVLALGLTGCSRDGAKSPLSPGGAPGGGMNKQDQSSSPVSPPSSAPENK